MDVIFLAFVWLHPLHKLLLQSQISDQVLNLICSSLLGRGTKGSCSPVVLKVGSRDLWGSLKGLKGVPNSFLGTLSMFSRAFKIFSFLVEIFFFIIYF